MAKRKTSGTKKVPKRKTANSIDLLRRALEKQTKDILVRLVVGLAENDRTLQRTLEANFKVEAPAKDLVVATRQAIADATDFDVARMNYNFDYDLQAYNTAKRNFKRLIKNGQWNEAMEPSQRRSTHVV